MTNLVAEDARLAVECREEAEAHMHGGRLYRMLRAAADAIERLQDSPAEPAGDPLALAIVEEVIRQHPQIECKGGKCPETMWCEQEAECLWTRWNK